MCGTEAGYTERSHRVPGVPTRDRQVAEEMKGKAEGGHRYPRSLRRLIRVKTRERASIRRPSARLAPWTEPTRYIAPRVFVCLTLKY